VALTGSIVALLPSQWRGMLCRSAVSQDDCCCCCCHGDDTTSRGTSRSLVCW